MSSSDLVRWSAVYALVVVVPAVFLAGCRKFDNEPKNTFLRFDQGYINTGRNMPRWDPPSVANGFHPVKALRGKCPPRGYQLRSAHDADDTEHEGSPP